MTLQRKSFAEALTFSRAGEATFFGSNGLLQTAAAGVPRFEYDPVTLAPKGILIEGTRQNLFLRSNEFDNAAWGKSQLTVTANSATGPDGALSADALVENTANDFHFMSQYVNGLAALNPVTISVYVKSNGRTKVRLQTDASGGSANMDVDLALGISPSGTASNRIVENVGGGWYRCSFRVTTDADGGAVGLKIILCDVNYTSAYLGDGVSGVYLSCAQLEVGAFPSSYIPTTTVAISRAADNLYMTPEQFAPWYRQDAGSIGVLFRPNTNGVGPTGAAEYSRIWELDNVAAPSDDIRLYVTSLGNVAGANIVIGGLAQTTLEAPTTLGTGALTRHAFGFAATDFAATLNGGSPLTDASGTLPTPNRMTIGSANAGVGVHLFGHIAELLYFPQRLANADLQQVCA